IQFLELMVVLWAVIIIVIAVFWLIRSFKKTRTTDAKIEAVAHQYSKDRNNINVDTGDKRNVDFFLSEVGHPRRFRYAGRNYRHRLEGFSLVGANLSGLDLSQYNLANCDFSNANMANVNLQDAHLLDVNLTSANLQGANLSYLELFNVKFDS